MLTLSANITVGTYTFKRVVEVQVNDSYETLTNKATIKIPHKLQFGSKTITKGGQTFTQPAVKIDNGDSIFHIGDAVSIAVGYNSNNTKIFTGFVTSISSGIPIVITAEDESWLLKKIIVGGNFGIAQTEPLADFLKQYLPATIPFSIDTRLADFQISYKSKANNLVEILRQMKDETGVVSYMQGGTLYCTMPRLVEQNAVPANLKVFTFGRNIILDDLFYYNKTDYLVRIKAVNRWFNGIEYQLGTPDWVTIDEDGQDPQDGYFVGDADGVIVPVDFVNIQDKATLVNLANLALQAFKYTGYRGSFKTFGQPTIKSGDFIKIENLLRNDRPTGTYLVREVKYPWGMQGFFQDIDLDILVANG